jgi:hypothetical protein
MERPALIDDTPVRISELDAVPCCRDVRYGQQGLRNVGHLERNVRTRTPQLCRMVLALRRGSVLVPLLRAVAAIQRGPGAGVVRPGEARMASAYVRLDDDVDDSASASRDRAQGGPA